MNLNIIKKEYLRSIEKLFITFGSKLKFLPNSMIPYFPILFPLQQVNNKKIILIIKNNNNMKNQKL